MAVGAHRSFFGTCGDRPSMHTLLVRQIRLRTLPAGFHYKLLPVTASARYGKVCMIYTGFRITGSQ